MTFQPGDMVEWIGDDHARARCVDQGMDDLSDGSVYVVRRVLANLLIQTTSKRGVGLEIEGHIHPRLAYPAEYFRKLYRPDAKLIERLTAEPVIMPPAYKPAREDA